MVCRILAVERYEMDFLGVLDNRTRPVARKGIVVGDRTVNELKTRNVGKNNFIFIEMNDRDSYVATSEANRKKYRRIVVVSNFRYYK